MTGETMENVPLIPTHKGFVTEINYKDVMMLNISLWPLQLFKIVVFYLD